MEILPIIATVLGLAFWLLRRGIEHHDDPSNQHENRYETIDKDIASRNSEDATAHATADLDELDRVRNQSGGGVR